MVVIVGSFGRVLHFVLMSVGGDLAAAQRDRRGHDQQEQYHRSTDVAMALPSSLWSTCSSVVLSVLAVTVTEQEPLRVVGPLSTVTVTTLPRRSRRSPRAFLHRPPIEGAHSDNYL